MYTVETNCSAPYARTRLWQKRSILVVGLLYHITFLARQPPKLNLASIVHDELHVIIADFQRMDMFKCNDAATTATKTAELKARASIVREPIAEQAHLDATLIILLLASLLRRQPRGVKCQQTP